MLILGLLSVWRMVQCRWRISHNYVYSPSKACTVFSSCNRLLKKDFGMGDGERGGREIGFPQRETKSILHCWTCMPLSFALGHYPLLPSICSFYHLLPASRPSPSPSLQRREVINSVLLRYLLWLQLNVSLFSLKIKKKSWHWHRADETSQRARHLPPSLMSSVQSTR